MQNREELIHDLGVIGHLAGRLDVNDRKQVGAILILQRDEGLFKTEYGKRFIGRLISIFTGKKVVNACIFTGQPTSTAFPVSDEVLSEIKKSPETVADALLKKPTSYMIEELKYRQREAKAEEENRRIIQEQEEIKKAQSALDKEEVPYKAVKEKAEQVTDAVNAANAKAREFSYAEEGDSNSVIELFRDIQKTWRYLRLYIWLFLVFMLTGYWFIMTGAYGSVVFETVTGAGLAPAALVLFLKELTGVYEEEPEWKKTILMCGAGALIALLMNWITGGIFTEQTVIHLFLRAVIEEAVIFLVLMAAEFDFIKKYGHRHSTLKGIFEGACFGAGMAFYEVCDMAFTSFAADQKRGLLMWHLISQSILSVGGRAAWCAAIGGALTFIVKKADVIKSQEFIKMCLLSLVYPLVMQICWESGFMDFGVGGVSVKNIFLMIVALMVLNLFLHRGIREAQRKKEQADV